MTLYEYRIKIFRQQNPDIPLHSDFWSDHQINVLIIQLSTVYVDNMLKRLPSNAQMLGVVINSSKGSLAQAHIISNKLKLLSKTRGVQIYTFIEDSAVNAGFLLATSG